MNKTLHNVIYNISYQVLNMIIPLITAPYIARVMGPSGVGVYSYSTSIANYAAVFMLLGIANYGSRTIAFTASRGKEALSKKFWEMYLMQAVSSTIVLLVYGGWILLTDMEYKTALLAQVFFLLSVSLDISWYFTGTGQFKITVARGVIIKVLQTVLIFALVKNERDLIVYILIITVGALVGQFALWSVALKQIGFAKVSIRTIKGHIKPNLILFLPLLASSVFVYMDKIMLQIITDVTSNLGWYEYAEKIVRLPLTVISAIGAVMMPKISSLVSEKGETEAGTYMGVSMRYIAAISSAMCFGIFAIAPELSVVYLGQDFAPCGALMQALSCIIIFSSFANILRTQYMIPMKQEKSYATSIIAGSVVNLLLNLIFIPMFGAMGAVIGTIGAEASVCVGHIWNVRKKLSLRQYVRDWIHFILCGVFMLLMVRGIGLLISEIRVRLVVEIAIGVLIYSGVATTVLCMKKDKFILRILKKRGE